jgi:hypothetical protein
MVEHALARVQAAAINTAQNKAVALVEIGVGPICARIEVVLGRGGKVGGVVNGVRERDGSNGEFGGCSGISRGSKCATSIRCWIPFVKPSISGIYVTIHVTTKSGCSENGCN